MARGSDECSEQEKTDEKIEGSLGDIVNLWDRGCGNEIFRGTGS